MKLSFLGIGFLVMMQISAFASEVQDFSGSDVRVRINPKTGKPFVSIVDAKNPEARKIFSDHLKKYSRPDYQMLDHRVKSNSIAYDGPSSSRKKVYLFAATLAASGLAAGTLLPVTAATGAGAGSGVGYAIAGTGVAAGTAGSAWLKSRPDPDKDEYKHDSEARIKREE